MVKKSLGVIGSFFLQRSDASYQWKAQKYRHSNIDANIQENMVIEREQSFDNKPCEYPIQERLHQISIAFAKSVAADKKECRAEPDECRSVNSIYPRDQNLCIKEWKNTETIKSKYDTPQHPDHRDNTEPKR